MGIHEHAVRGHRKFLRLRTPHCCHSNACQLCINLAEYQGIGRIRNRPAVSLSLVFPWATWQRLIVCCADSLSWISWSSTRSNEINCMQFQWKLLWNIQHQCIFQWFSSELLTIYSAESPIERAARRLVPNGKQQTGHQNRHRAGRQCATTNVHP